MLRDVSIYMEALFAGLPPGASLALKVFFSVVEILIIGAGIYLFQQRKKLFAHIGQEGDTSASANLRLAMVVMIWIHSVVLTAIMILEV